MAAIQNRAAKIREPGPVTVFGTRTRQMSGAQVRDYALRNQHAGFLWLKEWDVQSSLADLSVPPWARFRYPFESDAERREHEK
jgi:hypothetical protein